MDRALRCPFCVTVVPRRSLISRVLAFGRARPCVRCGRSFSRKQGEYVARLFDGIWDDFQRRVVDELKTLKICDRGEVLVSFGLRMDNAKTASVGLLLRSLAEQLEPQLAGLARGSEGRINISQIERGNCQMVDIDVMVGAGNHSRRLRIARIDNNGYIQAELGTVEAGPVRQIAR